MAPGSFYVGSTNDSSGFKQSVPLIVGRLVRPAPGRGLLICSFHLGGSAGGSSCVVAMLSASSSLRSWLSSWALRACRTLCVKYHHLVPCPLDNFFLQSSQRVAMQCGLDLFSFGWLGRANHPDTQLDNDDSGNNGVISVTGFLQIVVLVGL